jgi:indoleamine 2,3-dioxygenase
MSGLIAPYFEKRYSDGFFDVSGDHGFLPIRDPLKVLPSRYAALQQLMDDMPTHKVYPDVPGVLARPNEIEARVRELPDYTETVKEETDVFVIHALYRALSFLVSAYTLEQAYHTTVNGMYGKARRFVPGHIARPLVWVSDCLDVYPFLDYHYAYSLGNYVKKDPAGSLDWRNLDMACRFSGTPDETGFIMLHVYINEIAPALVNSVMRVGRGEDIKTDLRVAALTMVDINARRKEMWAASRHERYNDFRVFIMGVKGNEDLFGEGLVYESCFADQPRQYRGQTGAQDSIIPMMDIFTGIVDHYPQNKLTEYLMDLRTYRPKCIQGVYSIHHL